MSELNIEQQKAFDLALKGASFFMTGPGGVGKTYLIEKITDALNARDKLALPCFLDARQRHFTVGQVLVSVVTALPC